MKALAVDLGGSHAACAVVADREVVAVETVSLEAARGLAGALPVIAEALKRAASRAGVPAVGLRRPRLRLLRPRGHGGRPGALHQRQVRRRAGAGPAAVVPGVVRPAVPDRERRAPRAPRRTPRRGGAGHGRRGDDDPRDRHRRGGHDRGATPPREALPGRRPRRAPRGRLRGPALHLRRRRLRRGRGLDLGPARRLPGDAGLRGECPRPARAARLRGALRLRRGGRRAWPRRCATAACASGPRGRWR